LKDFITKAGERGIVVELCFFNAQYSDTWPISPLYYENNVQGVGKCDYQNAQTMRPKELVQRESDYVAKITQEVNQFDNVVLEMCDEAPDIGFPPTPIEEAARGSNTWRGLWSTPSETFPKNTWWRRRWKGPWAGRWTFPGSPTSPLSWPSTYGRLDFRWVE